MPNRICTYRHTACAAALMLAVGGLWVPKAFSAADESPVSILDQARFKYSSYGLRTGSFIFSPGITVSETYDDNVYKTNTNERSDFITLIRPSFSGISDFDLHEVAFRTTGSFGRYADNDSEDFDDFTVDGSFRLDLDYETYLRYSGSYRKTHESRESEDDANGNEPVTYFLTTHKANFVRALGLIKLYVEGLYSQFTYEDVQAGNLRIDNSGRDRDIYSADARLAYEYFPGYNIYAAITYDWRRYDNAAASTRDSDGFSTRFGTDVYLTGALKADVYVGYLSRTYDGNFSDISATNYGGSIVWNATGLTSIRASVDRGVNETIYGDASSNLSTTYSFGVEHMLRDNLFLSANSSLSDKDFSARTTPRDDTVYGTGVGIEYIPFNGTSVNLNYNYSQRDSSVVTEDYTSNRVTLSFSKQF